MSNISSASMMHAQMPDNINPETAHKAEVNSDEAPAAQSAISGALSGAALGLTDPLHEAQAVGEAGLDGIRGPIDEQSHASGTAVSIGAGAQIEAEDAPIPTEIVLPVQDSVEDAAPVPAQDAAAVAQLDEVHTVSDMLAQLDVQGNPQGVPDIGNGFTANDDDYSKAMNERQAQSQDFMAERQADLASHRDDLTEQLKAEGKTFDDLSDDEKADYYSQMLHTSVDMQAEQGQLEIDLNQQGLDAGRDIVDAHADTGDLDATVISADRDKLDELAQTLNDDRETHDRQTATMHMAADEITAKIREGESYDAARQDVLAAHYDDLPPEVQATVDNASTSDDAGPDASSGACHEAMHHNGDATIDHDDTTTTSESTGGNYTDVDVAA